MPPVPECFGGSRGINLTGLEFHFRVFQVRTSPTLNMQANQRNVLGKCRFRLSKFGEESELPHFQLPPRDAGCSSTRSTFLHGLYKISLLSVSLPYGFKRKKTSPLLAPQWCFKRKPIVSQLFVYSAFSSLNPHSLFNPLSAHCCIKNYLVTGTDKLYFFWYVLLSSHIILQIKTRILDDHR